MEVRTTRFVKGGGREEREEWGEGRGIWASWDWERVWCGFNVTTDKWVRGGG